MSTESARDTVDTAPIIIAFQFRVNSRIESGTSYREVSPVVTEVRDELAQDTIVIGGGFAAINISLIGYEVKLPIQEFTVENLTAKYQTALGYLAEVIDEHPRQLRPSVILKAGNKAPMDSGELFREHEDTLREFADDLFDERGTREIIGDNSHAKLKYTDTVISV